MIAMWILRLMWEKTGMDAMRNEYIRKMLGLENTIYEAKIVKTWLKWFDVTNGGQWMHQ